MQSHCLSAHFLEIVKCQICLICGLKNWLLMVLKSVSLCSKLFIFLYLCRTPQHWSFNVYWWWTAKSIPQAEPKFSKNCCLLFFLSFFWCASVCVWVWVGGCFVWFVHDGLSSTLLNGMGHETKLRHATCLRGIQPEFKALLLIMIFIKRLFDVIGWSMSIEKKQEKEK